MKKVAISIFILLLNTAVYAQQAATQESVEKLMELTEASKMIDIMYAQLAAMSADMASGMKGSDKEKQAFNKYMQKVTTLMKQDISWDRLKEPMIKIYTKHFSEEEIQGLISFYGSDLGKSMTRKMPFIMQDSMQISQQMMKDFMPKMQALAIEMHNEINKSSPVNKGKKNNPQAE
jgi:hypothetical protein